MSRVKKDKAIEVLDRKNPKTALYLNNNFSGCILTELDFSKNKDMKNLGKAIAVSNYCSYKYKNAEERDTKVGAFMDRMGSTEEASHIDDDEILTAAENMVSRQFMAFASMGDTEILDRLMGAMGYFNNRFKRTSSLNINAIKLGVMITQLRAAIVYAKAKYTDQYNNWLNSKTPEEQDVIDRVMDECKAAVTLTKIGLVGVKARLKLAKTEAGEDNEVSRGTLLTAIILPLLMDKSLRTQEGSDISKEQELFSGDDVKFQGHLVDVCTSVIKNSDFYKDALALPADEFKSRFVDKLPHFNTSVKTKDGKEVSGIDQIYNDLVEKQQAASKSENTVKRTRTKNTHGNNSGIQLK